MTGFISALSLLSSISIESVVVVVVFAASQAGLEMSS